MCRDWANELGFDGRGGDWAMSETDDFFVCALASIYFVGGAASGKAWRPGNIAIMSEYCWFDENCAGIEHEIGHGLGAIHQSGYCYPEFSEITSPLLAINPETVMGGGLNACTSVKFAESEKRKVVRWTDRTKQHCQEGVCVTLGNDEFDNAQTIKDKLAKLISNRNMPKCPNYDYRGICVYETQHNCAPTSLVGKYDVYPTLESCAADVAADPSLCPSGVLQYARSQRWSCLCCTTASLGTEHDLWSVYQVKGVGTSKPSPAGFNDILTLTPTPAPVTSMPPTFADATAVLEEVGFKCERKIRFGYDVLSVEQCAKQVELYPEYCPSKLINYPSPAYVESGCWCCEEKGLLVYGGDKCQSELVSWYLISDTEQGGNGCAGDTPTLNTRSGTTVEQCKSNCERYGATVLHRHKSGYCACYDGCELTRAGDSFGSDAQVFQYKTLNAPALGGSESTVGDLTERRYQELDVITYIGSDTTPIEVCKFIFALIGSATVLFLTTCAIASLCRTKNTKYAEVTFEEDI